MIVSVLHKLSPINELIKFNQILVDIPNDFTKQETFEELKIRAAFGVKYNQFNLAYKLYKHLQRELYNKNQETKEIYEPILTWLQYAAMPNLTIEELVDFFKKFNFTIILKDEDFNDLIGILRLRLSLEDINERDTVREKIYNALHENENKIMEFSISSGQKIDIASWLRLYDGSIGLEPAESIAIAEFNNQSAINFKLDEEGKILWKRLINFYEYIKLSSFDTLGFEEDVVVKRKGGDFLLSGGELIDLSRIENELKSNTVLDKKIKSQTNLVTPVIIALPSLADIIKQSQSYLLSTNGEIVKIIFELQKSLATGNVLGVTAALVLLAQLRRLDDILIDEPSFQALVVKDLEKSGQVVQREGLAAKPNAPQFLARFLKVLLQDNLHIKADEAMKFTERLGEFLVLEGEVYRRLVITDERGQKRWNT